MGTNFPSKTARLSRRLPGFTHTNAHTATQQCSQANETAASTHETHWKLLVEHVGTNFPSKTARLSRRLPGFTHTNAHTATQPCSQANETAGRIHTRNTLEARTDDKKPACGHTNFPSKTARLSRRLPRFTHINAHTAKTPCSQANETAASTHETHWKLLVEHVGTNFPSKTARLSRRLPGFTHTNAHTATQPCSQAKDTTASTHETHWKLEHTTKSQLVGTNFLSKTARLSRRLPGFAHTNAHTAAQPCSQANETAGRVDTRNTLEARTDNKKSACGHQFSVQDGEVVQEPTSFARVANRSSV